MFASSIIALALASVSIAAPTSRHFFGPGFFKGRPARSPRGGACDMSNFTMVETAGLPAPPGAPSFIGIGIGTQNYTCSDDGTYAAVGALADIYDISCLTGTPMFDTIQDKVLQGVPRRSPILGTHFFEVTADGTFPKWDFTASQKSEEAFVRVTKISALPAPVREGQDDVSWLELEGVAGGLGTKVYRTDTRLGVQPTSCTPGSEPIAIQYSAKYWFFGATLTPSTA